MHKDTGTQEDKNTRGQEHKRTGAQENKNPSPKIKSKHKPKSKLKLSRLAHTASFISSLFFLFYLMLSGPRALVFSCSPALNCYLFVILCFLFSLFYFLFSIF